MTELATSNREALEKLLDSKIRETKTNLEKALTDKVSAKLTDILKPFRDEIMRLQMDNRRLRGVNAENKALVEENERLQKQVVELGELLAKYRKEENEHQG